ncbi:MAG: hypothetical protein PHS30_01365 [Bacteroidales bacterium]|nr:hypothetical protein [Bacteroidales bacterium]
MMTKQKEVKEKNNKKAPEKNLKEKRAAKAAKRAGKDSEPLLNIKS